jgi:hypothetical protein
MKLTLTPDEVNAYCSELHDSNAAFKVPLSGGFL